MNGTLWTEELKRRAFELRAEGLSASSAAKIMSHELGKTYTKGMLIGIWDRNPPETLDPKTLVSLLPAVVRNEYFVRAKKRFMRERKTAIKFTEGAALKIVKLKPNECRYPVGDLSDKDFRFCCNPIVEGIKSSYCYEHHKICHYTPRKFSGKELV